MKNCYCQIKVVLENEGFASQNIAGGVPNLNCEPVTIRLDGSDEEIIYKLLVNTIATYSFAIDKEKWMEKIPELRNKLKKLINNL